MEKIILNGEDLITKEWLFNVLRLKFRLPKGYKGDLSILKDNILNRNGNLIVVWRNFNLSKRHLGEYADELLNFFLDIQGKYPKFSIELK